MSRSNRAQTRANSPARLQNLYASVRFRPAPPIFLRRYFRLQWADLAVSPKSPADFSRSLQEERRLAYSDAMELSRSLCESWTAQKTGPAPPQTVWEERAGRRTAMKCESPGDHVKAKRQVYSTVLTQYRRVAGRRSYLPPTSRCSSCRSRWTVPYNRRQSGAISYRCC
jgi:hypothetical protein